VNFYRRFIFKFAQIAQPCYALLKEGARWVWGTDQQNAFEKLRDAISSGPILMRPDYAKPFQLATDASKHGYAGVLSQFDENGREHPVLYISRSCTPAEKNYGSSELEAAAAIWAMETRHNYIVNTHFTLITDHDSLRWLLIGTKRNRLNRWAVRLQAFDFTIKHRAGRKNSNVDYFSRAPLTDNTFPPVDPLDRAPYPSPPDSLLPTLKRKANAVTFESDEPLTNKRACISDPITIDSSAVQTRSQLAREQEILKSANSPLPFPTQQPLPSKIPSILKPPTPLSVQSDLSSYPLPEIPKVTKRDTWTPQQHVLRASQESDPFSRVLIKYFENKSPIPASHAVAYTDRCQLRNGILCIRSTDKSDYINEFRIYVPADVRPAILHQMHVDIHSGNLGIRRTIKISTK
jgi:hypothetical protein